MPRTGDRSPSTQGVIIYTETDDQGRFPEGGGNGGEPLKENRVLEGRNGSEAGRTFYRGPEMERPFISLDKFTFLGLSLLAGRIEMI